LAGESDSLDKSLDPVSDLGGCEQKFALSVTLQNKSDQAVTKIANTIEHDDHTCTLPNLKRADYSTHSLIVF
jgi:hypothetical protein